MLVDKLPDAANLAIGALVFGQLLGGELFSQWLALLGLGLWALFMTWAALLAGGDES